MNYNSLFNLLYSTEISEATKAEIISKLNQPIEESVEVQPLVETYLELLDTLVFSTASEALIYNIIDETFSSLDEEFINEVSNEWVKRKVQDSMAARKAAADKADKSIKGGVIGLSQIRKHDIAHNNLEKGQAKADSIMNKVERRKAVAAEQKASEPKAEGAIGKLKSAVGKVKSWASNVDKGPEHVGLSRMIGAKANKDNIGAETLRQQTTHKEEAPTEKEVKANKEIKTPEPKAEAPKAKKTSPDEKFKKAMDLGDKIHKQVQDDAKRAKKEQEAREKEQKKNLEKLRKDTVKEVKAEIKNSQKKEKSSKEVKAEKVEQPKEVKSEVKADDATKAAKAAKKTSKKTKATQTTKETIKNGKSKVAQAIASTEEKPKEVKAEKVEQPKEDKPAEVKAEAPKKEENIKLPKVKTETEKYMAKVKREEAARRKDQERVLQNLKEQRAGMTSKPGYDEKAVQDLDDRIANLEKTLSKAKVNEALSDFVVLLLNTNISESCFMEVVEMAGANKANAQMVVDRDEKEAMAAIDDINKDLEAGKPMDPEKIKKAETFRQKYENAKRRYENKFSQDN